MATITHLPDDVIIIILEIESIRVEDIINFKSTCKRFQQITLFQKFWEKKYYQSCPTAEKKYNREKQKKIFHHTDFKKRIKAGLYCIQMLKRYAFMMSENKVCDTDKEQLECLLHSIVENSMTYYFVWDEINRISAERSCKLFSNLTREYNFNLIFYYLKQYRYIYKQVKFKNMPKTKSLLEKQLTIMAQYFQPHVSSAVKTWLDSITETVLSRLKNKYPAHSICSTTLEQFSFWRDNNIYDNFWNETESRQIMCILEEYIFSGLEIHKLYQLLMMSDLVAKGSKSIAVSFRIKLLTVTYHIVARRLGIHSVLTMRLNAILWEPAIIWKPNYNTNNLYNAEYFYVSNDTNLLYPSNIIRKRVQNIAVLMTSSNDFMFMGIEVMTDIFNVIYLHAHFFFILEYDFIDVEDIEDINIEIVYKSITNTIEVRSNAVEESLKRRTNDVKFAVGMIVMHIDENSFSRYHHYGVIIGWHRGYDIEIENKFKETIMFPYLHKCGDCFYTCLCQRFSASAHQLYYIILSENNIVCYMQQDQLSICPPKRINNVEIGRYFSSFEGTYYVPNESLRKHYPEDTAAIAKILTKQ